MFKQDESKLEKYRKELERQQERKLRLAADSESYIWSFPTIRKNIQSTRPSQTGWLKEEEIA